MSTKAYYIINYSKFIISNDNISFVRVFYGESVIVLFSQNVTLRCFKVTVAIGRQLHYYATLESKL